MIATIQRVELPVTLSPGRRWSDEELFQFCIDNRDLRVERNPAGEIVLMSPTGSETGARNAELTGQLYLWTRADGRGKCFDSSTGFTLADGSMLSPDACWISTERWTALSTAQRKRFAPVCPEFIVELRSESDRLRELREKMQVWIANGAQRAWLLDPQERKVEIFRHGREPEGPLAIDRLTGDGPVSGFTLNLLPIWSDLA